MSDVLNDNGITEAPPRYTQQERETIDRQRDRCREEWGELGDAVFATHCDLQVMKYEDRDGSKGDPLGDGIKAGFYSLMAKHIRGEGEEDPRCQRPGFVAYEYGGDDD